MKKILFIDRDGTIIREPDDEQIDAFEKLQFVPRAISSLAFLRQHTDYAFVMVSNQDGLGTNSFPEETFWPVHNFILQSLEGEGITFDDMLIDRHFPEDNHPNRKPGTGMLGEYMGRMYLNIREVWLSPNALPVSTNAILRRDMVFALTIRAYDAHATKDIAMIVLVRLFPSTVTTASARIVPGMHHVRSVIKERTLSVHFPKKPHARRKQHPAKDRQQPARGRLQPARARQQAAKGQAARLAGSQPKTASSTAPSSRTKDACPCPSQDPIASNAALALRTSPTPWCLTTKVSTTKDRPEPTPVPSSTARSQPSSSLAT